jgi:hypothetical protein
LLAVKASPGGFEYVNGEIKRRLGAWLLRSGQAAVERAREQPAVLDQCQAALSTAANLSRLLRDRHEHELALKVEDAALEPSFKLRRELRATVAAEGKRSAIAALSPTEAVLLRVSRAQAAMLIYEPGGANRAVSRLRMVVARERASASFGPMHKDTLNDMKTLADAIMDALSSKGVLNTLDRAGLRWLVRRVLRPARKRVLLLYRRNTAERGAWQSVGRAVRENAHARTHMHARAPLARRRCVALLRRAGVAHVAVLNACLVGEASAPAASAAHTTLLGVHPCRMAKHGVRGALAPRGWLTRRRVQHACRVRVGAARTRSQKGGVWFRPVQSLEATRASMPRGPRVVGEMSATCRRRVGEVLNAASPLRQLAGVPRPRGLRFAPGGGRAH